LVIVAVTVLVAVSVRDMVIDGVGVDVRVIVLVIENVGLIENVGVIVGVVVFDLV